MHDLYLETCQTISRVMTNRYSTSFSLGIRVFPMRIRSAIYSIYGFVRVADEIVDTFHCSEQEKLFHEFKLETRQALKRRLSTNPVLHSFVNVVDQYQIDHEYINAFLKSMEMDLTIKTHTRETYQQYIYGSAEVVGLMCLKVFCVNNKQEFESLISPARKLGAAFQKVNFLRDLKADFKERGRIYLPNVKNSDVLTREAKETMEREIEEEFEQSLDGIKALPRSAKLGVYSAYLLYTALFKKIKETEIQTLLIKRIRIPYYHKVFLFIKAFFMVGILRKE